MSGSNAEDWASKGVPHSVMLAKPFAPAQLVTAVSQLLNAAPPTTPEKPGPWTRQPRVPCPSMVSLRGAATLRPGRVSCPDRRDDRNLGAAAFVNHGCPLLR
jgi:hypothetical protein